MRVVGVDACRRGWIAVTMIDGVFVTTAMASSLSTLLDGAQAVGILPDPPQRDRHGHEVAIRY